MTRNLLTIIAGLAFAPISASAQPGKTDAVFRFHIEGLQASGFLGIEKISVPQPPTDVQAMEASVEVGETKEALETLRREAKNETDLSGEIARALGFNFNGDWFPIKEIPASKVQDVFRFFNVTTFRKTPDIIIKEFRKVDGRKELRSYLISPNGGLKAAALTVKDNGKFLTKPIQVQEAQAGCQELLEFWIQYYRDNLAGAGVMGQ